MRFIKFIAVALVWCCIPVLAHGQSGNSYQEYRLGPMDVVTIEVQGEDEIKGEYRVTTGGMIDLGFYGDVEVAGLSETQLSDRITATLKEFLLRPIVRVRIDEFNSKPISVLGAVSNPGKLPIPGPLSLLNAIIEAGGFTNEAGSTLTVVRRAENGLTSTLQIPVDQLQAGASRYDIPVFSNDVITVSKVAPIYIYFQGSVENVGRQDWAEQTPITLGAAIAYAGGPSERASSKAVVRRTGKDGKTETLKVNYRANPGFQLLNGDVVEIKESFF